MFRPVDLVVRNLGRMSMRIPERIPERMPERMPGHLPGVLSARLSELLPERLLKPMPVHRCAELRASCHLIGIETRHASSCLSWKFSP